MKRLVFTLSCEYLALIHITKDKTLLFWDLIKSTMLKTGLQFENDRISQINALINDYYYCVLNAETWYVTGLELERLLLALATTIGLKAR